MSACRMALANTVEGSAPTPSQPLRVSLSCTTTRSRSSLEVSSEIEAWLELVAGSYNVLPMDAAAFRAWAKLMHHRSDTVYEDAMIAATAKLHGLTVVTRNTANFKPFGVRVLNPFKAVAA